MVGGLPARLSSEKLAASLVPAVAAVAVNRPAVALALKRGEVATPEALVVSVAWLAPPAKLAPAAAGVRRRRHRLARAQRERDGRALERLAAAVAHLHLQRLAVACADRRRLRSSAASALIVGGLPARLSSEKPAGSTTPAVEAVAVKVPAVVLAVNPGEVAVPEASVSSVAWVPPPSKLAPAVLAAAPRHRRRRCSRRA